MSGSVSTWIKRLADGDSEAATKLKRRFWRRVQSKAKQLIRITGLVSFDYEDVSENAFGDLVMDIVNGQAQKVVNRRAFWRQLERVAYLNALDYRRREVAKKRGGAADDVPLEEIPTDEYNIAMAMLFEEELERVSSKLDAEAREIIEKLRQGYSVEEIASDFKVSPRTINRKIAAIKDAVNKKS